MIGRAAALLSLLALGGCVTTGVGSVAKGECKVMERPRYAVRGAQSYDQDWIDSTIEGGIGACKWKRPAPRPPELDAPKVARKVAAVPAKPVGKVAKVAAKTKGWIWRAIPTLAKKPAPAPVAAPESSPIVPIPVHVVPITLPAPPRSKLDELLHPSEWSK